MPQILLIQQEIARLSRGGIQRSTFAGIGFRIVIAVVIAVENCYSFKVLPGDGRPRIVPARRKCLCLYFYFVEKDFGLVHVRITTWFPFMVQVCLNGDGWLAARLTAAHIGFTRKDNAFLHIDDSARAQELADEFMRQPWPKILSTFAARVNPLLGGLLSGMSYYWVTEQAEFATDIMFRDPHTLKPLYESLLKHAMVLRVETVINDPYEFKIRRQGRRRIRVNGRSYRAFNPLGRTDAHLFAAVLRGEHTIHGFRNRDLRVHLFPATKTPVAQQRRAAQVSRLLKLLHVHGLIAKIPRTRRWRVTVEGQHLLATMVQVHAVDHPETLMDKAA